MAIRTDFTAGEVLAAADLNDTFASKLNLAGGKILQIVRATNATLRTTTSTTFVDVTGSSVTITPQKSDSAIMIIAVAGIATSNATNNDLYSYFRITDSSGNPISGAQSVGIGVFNLSGTGTRGHGDDLTLIAYATPATTSAVTYKVQFRSTNASCTVQYLNDEVTGQMYAIEVSA